MERADRIAIFAAAVAASMHTPRRPGWEADSYATAEQLEAEHQRRFPPAATPPGRAQPSDPGAPLLLDLTTSDAEQGRITLVQDAPGRYVSLVCGDISDPAVYVDFDFGQLAELAAFFHAAATRL